MKMQKRIAFTNISITFDKKNSANISFNVGFPTFAGLSVTGNFIQNSYNWKKNGKLD